MAWTTPRTWADNELVTADLMNTHIRDNLNVLKSPPSDSYVCNEASDYTTTSTSFTDIDATNLALTITTTGGDVLVGFHATTYCYPTQGNMFFDIDVDGSRDGGDDGYIVVSGAAGIRIVSFVRKITGLSAGSHTFKMQWRMASGTGSIPAGAGTGGRDVHPQMWVAEIS